MSFCFDGLHPVWANAVEVYHYRADPLPDAPEDGRLVGPRGAGRAGLSGAAPDVRGVLIGGGGAGGGNCRRRRRRRGRGRGLPRHLGQPAGRGHLIGPGGVYNNGTLGQSGGDSTVGPYRAKGGGGGGFHVGLCEPSARPRRRPALAAAETGRRTRLCRRHLALWPAATPAARLRDRRPSATGRAAAAGAATPGARRRRGRRRWRTGLDHRLPGRHGEARRRAAALAAARSALAPGLRPRRRPGLPIRRRRPRLGSRRRASGDGGGPGQADPLVPGRAARHGRRRS
jgi:hypothetical protein